MSYEAVIDSYIDSSEIGIVFGDDTVNFLRFRRAYTPRKSFKKQLALKGGSENFDEAIGGDAHSA